MCTEHRISEKHSWSSAAGGSHPKVALVPYINPLWGISAWIPMPR